MSFNDFFYRYEQNFTAFNSSLGFRDKNTSIVPCDSGYHYNRSLFSETVVTEVKNKNIFF